MESISLHIQNSAPICDDEQEISPPVQIQDTESPPDIDQTPIDSLQNANKNRHREQVDDTHHVIFNAIGFGGVSFLSFTTHMLLCFYRNIVVILFYITISYFMIYLILDTIWALLQPAIVCNNANYTSIDVGLIVFHHIGVIIGLYITCFSFIIHDINVSDGFEFNERYFIIAVTICFGYIEFNTFVRFVGLVWHDGFFSKSKYNLNLTLLCSGFNITVRN